MNRKFIVLPKVKRRTLEDRDVWLWTQGKSKWLMNGKITVPCSMDEIIQKLFTPERETQWTLTFRHKEESNNADNN